MRNETFSRQQYLKSSSACVFYPKGKEKYSCAAPIVAIAGKVGVELGNSCLLGVCFYASLVDARGYQQNMHIKSL